MKYNLLILLSFCTFLLNAQKIEKAAALNLLKEATISKYPESSTVNVENEQVIINEQCVGTDTYEEYTKILNEQGKKQASQVYFGYDSNYDTVQVDLIEVIKNDGTTQKIDPKTILKKVSQSAYTSSSNIYSETGWILVGSIPNLEIGDIIHQKFTDITHKARMENNYSTRISIESYSTVLKSYFSLETPESLKMNVKHINKKEGLADFKEDTKDNKKIYTCTFGYNPQIIYEPNMDDADFFAYYIMFTTVDKWDDISKWYYGLVKDHLAVDKDIKEKVSELTKEAKTKKEKVSNIFYWVAQNIRYLGVDKEKNRPGYEPHDVTYTFKNRGGVCRDKAALLVAMLREAGVPSDPILILAGGRLNHAAPVMWFNHAVAVSYDENGKPEYFYDPTNETSKDFFPQYEEDCSYIIASKDGADLQVVPVSPASRNNTKISFDLNVDDQNNASGKVTINFKGLVDTYIRGYMMRITPTKRKEFLQNMLSNMHPATSITDYTISDPKDNNTNLTMTANFSIVNYIDQDAGNLFVPFEASKLSLSFIYQAFMRPFNLSQRNYPFKISNTFSIDINENVTFSQPITTISVPKIPNLDYNGFKLVSTNKLSDDHKEFSSNVSFKSENIHFSKEDFVPLKIKLSQLVSLDKLYLIGNASK